MNKLFPVFLKLEQLKVLLVGAGPVGLEKITAVLQNCPTACIHVVAERVDKAFKEYVEAKLNVELSERLFMESDLDGVDIALLATNNPDFNSKVRILANERHVLLNVADKPELCDFYLGSIVTQGNLKIGISTNGKSPTIAKRLKQFLKDILPEEIDETLDLMYELREQLRGDLQEKIVRLNEHTKGIVNERRSW